TQSRALDAMASTFMRVPDVDFDFCFLYWRRSIPRQSVARHLRFVRAQGPIASGDHPTDSFPPPHLNHLECRRLRATPSMDINASPPSRQQRGHQEKCLRGFLPCTYYSPTESLHPTPWHHTQTEPFFVHESIAPYSHVVECNTVIMSSS